MSELECFILCMCRQIRIIGIVSIHVYLDLIVFAYSSSYLRVIFGQISRPFFVTRQHASFGRLDMCNLPIIAEMHS